MLWFERPACLLFFLLVPIYFFLRKAGVIASFSLSLTLENWQGAGFVWKSAAFKAIKAAYTVLWGAGFAAAIFAAADFSLIKREAYYTGTSVPVVFIVDASPSMSAADMNGITRFDAAREGIRAFVQNRPGGSFALAALGTEAAMLVPPTTDRTAFLSRLDALKVGELGDGTAIGMGLAVAAFHLKTAASSSSCAVLFTDGESNSGEINPITAAELFRASGISLVIAGLGRRGYSDFLYEDPQSGIQYSGRFSSEFDEDALVKIAQAAGGSYVRADGPGSLESVFSTLEASAPVTAQGQVKAVPRSLSFECALCSLALFAAAWALRLIFLGGGLAL